LADATDVTALVLCTSAIGTQVMDALQSIGKDVPRDLSVVSIGGDDEIAKRLSLTAFANNYAEFAAFIRENTLNLLEGRVNRIGRIFINSFQLIERATVMPRQAC
jgi:DNA-binding LacI/PurR family transcriptional regulator